MMHGIPPTASYLRGVESLSAPLRTVVRMDDVALDDGDDEPPVVVPPVVDRELADIKRELLKRAPRDPIFPGAPQLIKRLFPNGVHP